MKKSLALVLAAVMVLAVCGAALAANPTGSVTITGLKSGDTVKLYKVLEWTNGNWNATSDYGSVAGINNFSEMTATKAQAIAAAATATTLVDGTGTANASGTYTKSGLEPGMYLAIVNSVDGATIYNPMIVSVNFNGSNAASDGTLNITSDTTIGYPAANASAVAKKQDIPFDKVVDTNSDPDNYETVEPGDEIPFKLTTKLPSYDAPYTSPIFRVSDTLTGDITLKANSIVVKVGGVDKTSDPDVVSSITANYGGTKTFTVTFNPDYLMRDGAVEDVEITYTGVVGSTAPTQNVQAYNNSAKLEYSHNPADQSDVKKVFDDTNHYTFSIDANANGLTGGKSITSELVKIGVDDAGNTITSWKVNGTSEWENYNELAGATFRLTKVSPGTFPDGTTTKEYTTTDSGHISFSGLEEGTYTLEEVSAPAGYVKSDKTVTITIEATMKTETRTQEGITYNVQVLDTYSITINDGSGNAVSNYTVTNISSDFGTVSTSDATTNDTYPYVNTKGLELPSTGGIGTTIFYVAGLLMVLGAGTVLVARRKADQE